VILGGSGSIPGVLLGAILIIGLPEVFQELQQYRLLIFGLALVAMMVFRPQGILPPKPHEYPVESLDESEVTL
ncbi:MAG TPA: branched-chain amino acid ABC transporter permease, partial [Desulfosalsimonadaceae bacterium]|nr:branched-chain amino acid ABC transporter permease [Desulfosalsimonadaceae bacterium]